MMTPHFIRCDISEVVVLHHHCLSPGQQTWGFLYCDISEVARHHIFGGNYSNDDNFFPITSTRADTGVCPYTWVQTTPPAPTRGEGKGTASSRPASFHKAKIIPRPKDPGIMIYFDFIEVLRLAVGMSYLTALFSYWAAPANGRSRSPGDEAAGRSSDTCGRHS